MAFIKYGDKYFLASYSLSFRPITKVFHRDHILNFILLLLVILPLSHLRTPYEVQESEDVLCFPLKCFIVLLCAFKSMIHLKITFIFQ